MKNILAATDFSVRSDRAVQRATMLARQTGAILNLIHVVDDDQPRRMIDSKTAAARTLLEEQAAALRDESDISCTASVILGDPFAGIVEAAATQSADLIVLGSHRRQTLRDMFVGTTAERTIRSTACPVLMVNTQPTGPYRQVLIATDLSEGSAKALAKFSELEVDSQTRRSIVHVYDVPALNLTTDTWEDEKEYYVGNAHKKTEQTLDVFLGALDLRIGRKMVRRDTSTPALEILAAAEEQSAEMIVLGKSAKSTLVKLFIGSVAEDVLRCAKTDVLTLSGDEQL